MQNSAKLAPVSGNALFQVLRKTHALPLVDSPLPGRFLVKVDFQASGCWLWTAGFVFPPGYPEHKYGSFAAISTKPIKTVKAHRYAYEKCVGPIPAKFDVDHTCNNKLCVNPSHLEAITHAENIRRRDARKAA